MSAVSNKWTPFYEVLLQLRNLMQKFIFSFPQSKHEHLNIMNGCEKLSRVQAMLSVPKLFKKLRFHLKTIGLSGSPVKHWKWSVGDLCSPSSHTGWCWPTQGAGTGALLSALQVSATVRQHLSFLRHTLLLPLAPETLLFVGVYITAGWESPAMGNQCILPAICRFHPLINQFLPKFIPPHPSPHFYLRVIDEHDEKLCIDRFLSSGVLGKWKWKSLLRHTGSKNLLSVTVLAGKG